MPKIIDNVIRTKNAMLQDKKLAAEIQELAQAAILGGMQSKAWETYVTRFCDVKDTGVIDDDQLRRLTGRDMKPAFDRNRAYLVANGMCGSFTREHFEVNVQSIDQGLNNTGC